MGQCAVTALVVQDRLGGRIRWTRAVLPGGEAVSHYLNEVDGCELDLTRAQFPSGTDVPSAGNRHPGVDDAREYVLSEPATARRYAVLRARMDAAAGDGSLPSLLRAVYPEFTRLLASGHAHGFEQESRAAVRVAAAWFLPEADLSRMRLDGAELSEQSLPLYFPRVHGASTGRLSLAATTLPLMAMAFEAAENGRQWIWGAIRPRWVPRGEVVMYLRSSLHDLVLHAALATGMELERARQAERAAIRGAGDIETVLEALRAL